MCSKALYSHYPTADGVKGFGTQDTCYETIGEARSGPRIFKHFASRGTRVIEESVVHFQGSHHLALQNSPATQLIVAERRELVDRSNELTSVASKARRHPVAGGLLVVDDRPQ